MNIFLINKTIKLLAPFLWYLLQITLLVFLLSGYRASVRYKWLQFIIHMIGSSFPWFEFFFTGVQWIDLLCYLTPYKQTRKQITKLISNTPDMHVPCFSLFHEFKCCPLFFVVIAQSILWLGYRVDDGQIVVRFPAGAIFFFFWFGTHNFSPLQWFGSAFFVGKTTGTWSWSSTTL